MIRRVRLSLAVAAAALSVGALSAARTDSGLRLTTAFASELAANGATTTADGRMFLVVQPRAGTGDPQVVEVRDGRAVPYPDSSINRFAAGDDPGRKFVGVNSLRVGPDGYLWAVDRGAAGVGKAPLNHGPKLVRIDIGKNRVDRIYDLAAGVKPKSFIDDVRFKGRRAYLTDAGEPGLVVLDLDSGQMRRVLDGDPSTTSHKALMAEHRPLLDPSGMPIVVHADQLEVSPNGKWLYFQPCSGGMSRIETRFLDDAALSAADLVRHVEAFTDTPSTGGTAIAANGTIYLSDVENSRILAISPQGAVKVLLADPRLAWVDAMWIDANGGLLLPSAQLNRTAGMNAGKDTVARPLSLYRLALSARPVAS